MIVLRSVALVNDGGFVMKVGELGTTVTTALFLISPHANPNHIQDVS